MLRLARRAGLLFASYLGLILAIVIAGFLGSAVGIWASIAWGVAILAALALYVRRRRQQRGEAPQSNPRPSA
jgi:FtsH-binding integral membrane protein